jgi:hypothetical protein
MRAPGLNNAVGSHTSTQEPALARIRRAGSPSRASTTTSARAARLQRRYERREP